jgi:ABC-2 type transport system ATP-binding protein
MYHRATPSSTTTDAISLEGVSCRFGERRALDDLTLRVPSGSVVGVVGPNGAGKTTLIDVVCGLLVPAAGRISVLGLDVGRDRRALYRRIGVVPQETALYDEVSALENLRLAAALFDVADAETKIARQLELVGLADRARDAAGELSGGMRRRLCIARALLHDPELLVLDEPTVGVDVEARHQIWRHIRTLGRQGRTVLLSTNHLDEAEALCDRVAMLREGRLVAEDTPAALVAATGRRLEIDCTEAEAPKLRDWLATQPGILGAELLPDGGLVAYLGSGDADELVRRAMDVARVGGFRARSPDLAEVFRALARR